MYEVSRYFLKASFFDRRREAGLLVVWCGEDAGEGEALARALRVMISRHVVPKQLSLDMFVRTTDEYGGGCRGGGGGQEGAGGGGKWLQQVEKCVMAYV
jgi:hypothetical protein